MPNERVLIVDDEAELACILRDYLKKEGFNTETVYDGASAIKAFETFKPQLVLLDVMLPDYDGMEVCRRIRAKSNIPIIMLSAKSSDIDKILGLGLGADDYISKPFSPGELVARIKAHIRRYVDFSAENKQVTRMKFGRLEIDDKAYDVLLDSKKIDLAAKEFELLSFMAHHPLQVFTREQLFNQIWGFDEYGDINTVTVHIRKIREKIEQNPSQPTFIKTVWGVGYKFDGDLR